MNKQNNNKMCSLNYSFWIQIIFQNHKHHFLSLFIFLLKTKQLMKKEGEQTNETKQQTERSTA